MFDYLIQSVPVLAFLFGYCVRIEVKLAEMNKDLCWIKKAIEDLK